MTKAIPVGICAAALVLAMSGCTVNSNKATSWGKENVSLLDFQTDTILCGTLANQAASGNAQNAAGGVDGKNGSGRIAGGAEGQAGGAASSGNASSIGGGTYEGHASPDMVSRAANQQRANEMQLKQVKVDTLRSCLTKRGYTEFELTANQRQELAQLKPGTDARQEYLYKLGTNPDNLKAGVKK